MGGKMKKILIGILAISCIFPMNVLAEEVTFGSIIDEYERAKRELESNNQSIENQEGQINKNNSTIRNLQNQIVQMEEEAVKLQEQITASNEQIDDKKEEIKQLVSYYQMSQGENIYLEYIFGGDTITDLVYRISIVEQITEYNEKTISDLESLINANESRKVELANTEKSYGEKINALDAEITKLNSSISRLSDLSPSLEQQVKAKQEQVEYYKSQGCKNRSDVIGRDCAVKASNAVFSRPVQTGYITSFVGYRGGNYVHRGLDIGSSQKKNAALYSIGNGVIKQIWNDRKDGTGSKNVTVQYRASNGQYYTAIYAHLSRYGNIKTGMDVTPNTILGYMGDTGNATGVHLHIEVWPCRLYEDSKCKSWSDYVNFTNQQFKNGFKGASSVISFPNKTFQTWYTR